MNAAKAAARQRGPAVQRSSAFTAALAAEREGGRLQDAKRTGEAAEKFYEAAGLFRSAEQTPGTPPGPRTGNSGADARGRRQARAGTFASIASAGRASPGRPHSPDASAAGGTAGRSAGADSAGRRPRPADPAADAQPAGGEPGAAGQSARHRRRSPRSRAALRTGARVAQYRCAEAHLALAAGRPGNSRAPGVHANAAHRRRHRGRRGVHLR